MGNKESIDEVSRALARTHNSDTALSQVETIGDKDPLEKMGEGVIDFIKGRVKSIATAEHLKTLIYSSLEEDLAQGNITIDQKLSIVMRLSRDSNELTESLLSILKPTGGQDTLPIADLLRPRGDKSEIARAFDGYTSEQLRRINETFKVLRDLVEVGGNNISIPQGEI